jgi:hypothetical protein
MAAAQPDHYGMYAYLHAYALAGNYGFITQPLHVH